MASPSRTSQFKAVHKVLKKHYQMVAPDPDRTVFQQLVFASCLENAHYDRAEEAFAALEHGFFDWNEIRVSTLRELSEAMACLPDPPAAANRVKRVLQSIFESTYSFDLEELRKQNLGPAVEYLKKLDGTTNFSVAYVTQVALGGHAIPVDAGALMALHVVELVNSEDVQAGAIRGLERAIAKSKGIEFGSQLHQFGAEFIANPFAPAIREVLLEINPDARARLPKRRARKRSQSSAEAAERRAARKEARRRARPETDDQTTEQKRKPSRRKKPSAEAKPTAPEDGEASNTDDASTDEQATPGTEKKSASSKKKPAAKGKADGGGTKSSSARLSKRKPR